MQIYSIFFKKNFFSKKKFFFMVDYVCLQKKNLQKKIK